MPVRFSFVFFSLVGKVWRCGGGKWSDDVLRRVVRGLLRGALGRGRDRSWRGERRPRGLGRHPPSRRPSAYKKRR
jgi:hypothetical protein